MNEFSTPMMRQYVEIKKQYPGCLLFYRMGDFYELFLEDAHVGAQILGITLTGKAGGKDGKIPMAGVPYHAVDSYIAKLVRSGYKVAICEQLSPPNKKGLVERDVVRIITPGTLLDENALEKKENNYIIGILLHDDRVGLAAADLSTGYLAVTEAEGIESMQLIKDQIARLQPAECIVSDELYNDADFLKFLRSLEQRNISSFPAFQVSETEAAKALKDHFKVKTLEGFGIGSTPSSLIASAALLAYLQETQKGAVSHIRKILPLVESEGLLLDRSSMINLELFATIRDHDTRGSLLFVIDRTLTAMGGRRLKQWLKKPLTEKEAIEQRYDAVDDLLNHSERKGTLAKLLEQIPDIERLLSRLAVNLGNARDLVNLKAALNIILRVKENLVDADAILLVTQGKAITPNIKQVISLIDRAIVDEPPLGIKEGGIIRTGINPELDHLRKIIATNKDWITTLEKEERQKTGISSLKIRYNQVFGFYIEVSKTNLHLVPNSYSRKQTLVNAERFITQELKDHEEIILTAEEKINEIEYKMYQGILSDVLSFTEAIQNAAESIAIVDCLVNFAELAERKRYVRPKLLYSGEIRIKGGRHPVVEQLLDETPFVPNDVTLDNISQSLLLITGPNMAGKSVFLRQVALIVLLAQMGSFVPAKSAYISIMDRIFVRSGASDVITSGLSTFMVEMVETANILHNATKNSFIIMDEIGRGTSTYDGISIAWAVAEYLVKSISPSPKVLFATHYHELQQLEERYPKQIKNFHMAVTDQNGDPVFLHTILPGGASHSFGVAVAKLAGIPDQVITRANELLQELETRQNKQPQTTSLIHSAEANSVPSSNSFFTHLITKELETIDVATMTPLEALNKLAKLKEKLQIVEKENHKFLEAD